ncbi:MarR family winged helix-turn-helix transcriptional regulator [Chitinophaga parva]|nr:MarR family transcriptional regulator [Chitinophaga parva]
MVGLIFVGNWIVSKHQQFFKRFDITMQQFNILRILRGQYPGTANINLLKDRMLDKMSDVSRLVERLRKAELVDRKSCPSDRRAVDVIITQKGLELLEAIDAEIDELQDDMTATLSEKEIQQLNKLLDKFLGSYPA